MASSRTLDIGIAFIKLSFDARQHPPRSGLVKQGIPGTAVADWTQLLLPGHALVLVLSKYETARVLGLGRNTVTDVSCHSSRPSLQKPSRLRAGSRQVLRRHAILRENLRTVWLITLILQRLLKFRPYFLLHAE